MVSGAAVHRGLAGRHGEVLSLVEDAYRLHGEGRTVNPPSYFLRFADRPTARIIALPASVGGDRAVDGLKWISSFPENLERGLPRASAALLLNDPVTGYPFACLEASIISAVRTAASAALAARAITATTGQPRRIGFVGTGLIARYVHEYLGALGWPPAAYGVFDSVPSYALAFADQVLGGRDRVRLYDSAEALIRGSDLVVFATTAAEPHVTDPQVFAHGPVVLHISLRDLSPEVILANTNIVDDIEHVLKADTSVHLAEQRVGHRDFLHATLYALLTGGYTPPGGRAVVFSPFGLGVLDLAVGAYAHRRAAAAGDVTTIGDFFHDLDRHRVPGGGPGAPAGQVPGGAR